jgi:signal transduction histidine kinase
MHDISHAGNHLLHLINDILDLSKIETGKSVLREEVVRLSYVIDFCTRIVKHRAEAKGIALNVDLEAVPRTLFADEQKLKQILINLITNGVKFTPAGGEVSIRCRQDRVGYVFEVADTGIGIAPQEVEKALSSFEQLDGALNRKFGGNGLGLSLSKSLTELHGGTLSLCSEVGVGTTVSVCFPLERIVDETSAESYG